MSKTTDQSLPVLACQNLNVSISDYRGRQQVILHEVNFAITHTDRIGIIGDSGSGKTTLARVICGLLRPLSGCVIRDGISLDFSDRSALINHQRAIRMVFQDSRRSFDPRYPLLHSLCEPLIFQGGIEQTSMPNAVKLPILRTLVGLNGIHEIPDQVREVLESLKLSNELINRQPHELSGGQLQRMALARAILAKPQMLVCDEITSALDGKTQDEVMNALIKAADYFHLTLALITHDQAVIEKLADRVFLVENQRVQEE